MGLGPAEATQKKSEKVLTFSELMRSVVDGGTYRRTK